MFNGIIFVQVVQSVVFFTMTTLRVLSVSCHFAFISGNSKRIYRTLFPGSVRLNLFYFEFDVLEVYGNGRVPILSIRKPITLFGTQKCKYYNIVHSANTHPFQYLDIKRPNSISSVQRSIDGGILQQFRCVWRANEKGFAVHHAIFPNVWAFDNSRRHIQIYIELCNISGRELMRDCSRRGTIFISFRWSISFFQIVRTSYSYITVMRSMDWIRSRFPSWSGELCFFSYKMGKTDAVNPHECWSTQSS